MSLEFFFNLFLIISAFYGFTFSIYVFSTKYIENKSLIFLTLSILSIALNNFQSWLIADDIIYGNFSVSYYEFPWHFFPSPLFYTFLIHYLGIQHKSLNILKLIVPLFALMCIAQFCLVIYCRETVSIEEFKVIIEDYRSFEEMFSFFVSISVFSYSFYIFKKRDDIPKSLLSYDNLNWIQNFLNFTTILYITWIVALLLNMRSTFSVAHYYPLRILTTLVSFFLGYQAIRQIRILKERKELRKNLINTPKISVNGASDLGDLTKSKHKRQFDEINDYIKDEKKFLIPKYTLQNLASDLNLSTSTLSSVINNNANKSFIDYINEMRISQAKEILKDSRYNNYTIVAIGLESGFNSKSTFYAVFKKHTGVTPYQYKESKNV